MAITPTRRVHHGHLFLLSVIISVLPETLSATPQPDLKLNGYSIQLNTQASQAVVSCGPETVKLPINNALIDNLAAAFGKSPDPQPSNQTPQVTTGECSANNREVKGQEKTKTFTCCLYDDQTDYSEIYGPVVVQAILSQMSAAACDAGKQNAEGDLTSEIRTGLKCPPPNAPGKCSRCDEENEQTKDYPCIQDGDSSADATITGPTTSKPRRSNCKIKVYYSPGRPSTVTVPGWSVTYTWKGNAKKTCKYACKKDIEDRNRQIETKDTQSTIAASAR